MASTVASSVALFDVPAAVLPEIVPSCGTGEKATVGPVAGVPLAAVLGDSHAALYAHGATDPGVVKVTYGTGSSVMRLTDHTAVTGACTTIAWADPAPRRAAEGNIRSSGATITWLGRLTGRSADDIAALAAASDNGGVHIVPAFGGLAAPWWDDSAVGVIDGLTFATTHAHLARAAIESIAFQVADVIEAMAVDGPPSVIVADGGASANDTLMRIQADVCGVPVRRASQPELSALGAAYLAGHTVGLWDAAPASAVTYDEFAPGARRSTDDWRTAVARARLS
jgi:glycerol kinase